MTDHGIEKDTRSMPTSASPFVFGGPCLSVFSAKAKGESKHEPK